MTEETNPNPLAGIVEGDGEFESEPDGSVSVVGEPIPDDVKVVEDHPVDDSKIEEPPEEVIGETEPVLSPLEQKFQDEGLSSQFPGGIEEMISKAKGTNQYIAKVEAERNAYRDNQKKTEPPQEVTEEFFEPETQQAINAMLDARDKKADERFAQIEAKTFEVSKADFKEMEPLMKQYIDDHPVLSHLPYSPEGLDIVYQLVKKEQQSQAKPPPATTKLDSASAVASTGKSKTALSPDDPEKWHDMTDAEIESELKMKPLY